jgi:hypothetical protein
MGVGELLDRIREQYVSQFIAAVKKLRRRRGIRVLSESAPVEAFEGLLDAVAALGTAEVVVGECPHSGGATATAGATRP